MLVSTQSTTGGCSADLRAVVVDEVHAFAGDDRGWHLLAVLERLTRPGRPPDPADRPVGHRRQPRRAAPLAAGSARAAHRRSRRAERGVAAAASVPTSPGGITACRTRDIELDYVGSRGQRRARSSPRCTGARSGWSSATPGSSSRSSARTLRGLGVTTFLSHASLSLDERRRAEQAFAEARDCVIVSTSTLELGIDVGDLDRVIQINAPLDGRLVPAAARPHRTAPAGTGATACSWR